MVFNGVNTPSKSFSLFWTVFTDSTSIEFFKFGVYAHETLIASDHKHIYNRTQSESDRQEDK